MRSTFSLLCLTWLLQQNKTSRNTHAGSFVLKNSKELKGKSLIMVTIPAPECIWLAEVLQGRIDRQTHWPFSRSTSLSWDCQKSHVRGLSRGVVSCQPVLPQSLLIAPCNPLGGLGALSASCHSYFLSSPSLQADFALSCFIGWFDHPLHGTNLMARV